jgi:hypothetical protein
MFSSIYLTKGKREKKIEANVRVQRANGFDLCPPEAYCDE